MKNVEFRKPKQDAVCRICGRHLKKGSEVCVFIQMYLAGKTVNPAFCRGCVEELNATFASFIQDYKIC